jgi:hypothetical protein
MNWFVTGFAGEQCRALAGTDTRFKATFHSPAAVQMTGRMIAPSA